MSSSKRHILVGELLQASKHFSHMRIAEEVSVSELVPDFPDNRKKVDWFIKDLRLVIEVHGEQHYQPVAFGGRNAKSEFTKQIHRDIEKQAAIENANYLFLEIPYWIDLTADWLWSAIHAEMEKSRYASREQPENTSKVLPPRPGRKKNGPRMAGRPFPLVQRKLKSRGFSTKKYEPPEKS